MSTRRGGKKKAAKQQTLVDTTAQRLQFGIEEAGDPRPAIPRSTFKAPASPAVLLAQKALSPVVTAVKAVSAAVLAAPAAAAASAGLASIPEDTATITTVDVDNDEVGTPRSHTAAAAADSGAFGAGTGAASSDAHPSTAHASHQQQHPASLSTPVKHQPEPEPGSEDMLGGKEEPSHAEQPGLAAGCAAWCSSSLQQLRQRTSLRPSMRGWGPAMLCAVLVVAMAAALIAQGRTLTSQAHAIQAQQQQVTHQARTLQQLQQQLQDTSAQLPSLAHAAQATSRSLSELAMKQAALGSDVVALSDVAQQLTSNMTRVDATSQHGQHAWQALAAVAGGAGAAQLAAAGLAGPQLTANGSAGSPAAAPPSSAAWLQQQLIKAQEQQAMQQQLMLQRQLASQLPPLDLALADCGARILFSTPVNASALQAQVKAAPGSGARAGDTMAQRVAGVLRALRQHLPGGGLATVGGSNSSAGLDKHQLGLLHRVVLRPASQLLPAACVPLSWTPQGAAVLEIQLPQAAYVSSVTLHAPAGAAPRSTSHMSGAWQLTNAPAHLTLALGNSSSCGGASAPCTTLFSGAAPAVLVSATAAGPGSPRAGGLPAGGVMKAGVQAALQEVHLDSSSYSSGRAVIPVLPAAGGAREPGTDGDVGPAVGSVLADRVVIAVSDVVGGRGDAAAEQRDGPCLARISVQGRPVDPAAFC